MDVPTALLFRPLPAWALYPGLVVFPLTIVFAELPTYFAYVMPRLSALSGRRIASALLTGFVLSAQHMAMPLLFDARFLAWRLAMFLLFAVWLALCVRWRPRLLPFLMVGHALLDSTLLLTILTMHPV